MCAVSAFAVTAYDARVCDVTLSDRAVCDITVGAEAVCPVTQVPSLALTRCETSPMSARP